MTGPELLLIWIIWAVAFVVYCRVSLFFERRREAREMERNMIEHRIRRNQRAIIEDMERGEW